MKVDIPKINIAEDKDYYSDWRDDLESLYKELDQGGGCFVDVDGTSWWFFEISRQRMIMVGFDRGGKIVYRIVGGRSKDPKRRVLTEDEGTKIIDIVMNFILAFDKYGFLIDERNLRYGR